MSRPARPALRDTPRGALDPRALARAEAALRSLSSEFSGWMAEETTRLEAARARVHADGGSRAAWDELHLRAHDLKGLGSTFGQPLATRLCASLCRLLDDPAHRAAAPLALVDAHVDAVRALAGAAPAADGPVDLARCEALEARVEEALAQRTG